MGIVVLAHDVALERPVAIKLLPPQLASDDRMRSRFVREARTAARLSHPNIVPIHSVEEHADAVFFVMGFVDGGTLSARIHGAGPLAPRDGAALIQELAWALAYAHSAGVIHRDVKPDNVLIDRASGRAMLTDFGIARAGDGPAAAGPGEIVGTPQFVSPEQAAGTAVDGRSDLYSLGVTAFYALTGRLPFESSTVMGLLVKHASEAPPPVATVRPSLPPKLAAAVDRCLAKDPVNRFATGEALATAIADARGIVMQVAPPVREFLRDRARTGHEVALLYFAFVYLGAFAHIPFVRIAGPLSLLAVASVERLLRTTRRVLRAGYGFDDVRSAIDTEADARLEEAGLANGDVRRERAQARVAITGVMIASILMIPIGIKSGHEAWSALAGIVAFAGFVYLWRTHVPMPRRQRRVEALRWLDRLWQGRLGKWFFAVAKAPDATLFARIRGWLDKRGVSAGRPSLAPPSTAPTEFVLAERAVALLRNLPPAARERLDDAGDVIERLHSRIRRLREREDELDTALSQAGDPRAALPRDVAGAGRTLVERRIELTKELEQARREVAGRHASASAALENIRLQLLRLHAGIGAPSDLTADLEAARAIERQISAAIEVNTAVSPAATLPEPSRSELRSHDSSLTSEKSGTPPLRA